MQIKSLKNDEYPPSEDTFFLADYIGNEKGNFALDIGSGSGYLTKLLAENFSFVVGTDINYEVLKDQTYKTKNLVCCNSSDALNAKFDFIICRAFAPLVKLLDYSRFFTKKNTSLLFLKGRSVKKEIHDAKKSYSFEYDLYPSQSEGDGYVLKINKYKKL